METIKDILNNVKDRLTNPLLFSFLCSWLIINWQITVSLFWFNSAQIEKTGYKSIYDFISAHLNRQNSLIYPSVFAISYTILVPILKNLISAFHAWTLRWGTNWNLQISKGVKVPFEKYLKFREDYDKRTKILEDVIIKESEYSDKYNSLNTELLEAKTRINDLTQRHNESSTTLQELYDVALLNGYWTNQFADSVDEGFKGSEDIFIENGNYYVIERFGERKHVFTITNFQYDNRSKFILFIKERVNFQKRAVTQGGILLVRSNVNRLKLERDGLLVGTENSTTKIEYRKKEFE